MIDYVSEEDTCRSAYLLEYFGQTESADCGTCDICRSSRKSIKENAAKSDDMAAEIVRYINEELQGSYTLDDVACRFGSPSSDPAQAYLTILRTLIDQGLVSAPERV